MQENKKEQNGWLASEFLSEDEQRRALAQHLGIPFVLLGKEDISQEALVLIPEPLSRAHSIVAYNADGGAVEVALLAIDDLQKISFLQADKKIKPRLTDQASITHALLLYQKHLKEKFGSALQAGNADALIRHALMSQASDVHLEVSQSGTRIRYRIQGALCDAMRLTSEAGGVLVQDIKSLAKLFPIAVVQEGKFKIENDEAVAVSVANLPIAGGEKLTMRLSWESSGHKGFTLSALGLHGKGLEQVHAMLHARSGLVLVCGPEGSGKTTTLYTLLDQLQGSRAIATIEEDIEHRLSHATQTQTQTRPEVGLTMLAGLRAVLRSDPDVVLIDEATPECVPVALSAVRRGMLVFAAAKDRDMFDSSDGGPKAIIDVRTAKKLCQHCKMAYKPLRADLDALEAADFGKVLAALKDESVIDSQKQWKDLDFFAPKGCVECEGGYKGVGGLQAVTDPEGACLNLAQEALFKAAQGLVSIEEALKVAGE